MGTNFFSAWGVPGGRPGCAGPEGSCGRDGSWNYFLLPLPQLSTSDYPGKLQTEEDDLEFLTLLPPAPESPPPERIKEGLQAEGL